jgi:hypothetical protein
MPLPASVTAAVTSVDVPPPRATESAIEKLVSTGGIESEPGEITATLEVDPTLLAAAVSYKMPWLSAFSAITQASAHRPKGKNAAHTNVHDQIPSALVPAVSCASQSWL